MIVDSSIALIGGPRGITIESYGRKRFLEHTGDSKRWIVDSTMWHAALLQAYRWGRQDGIMAGATPQDNCAKSPTAS